MAFHYDPKKPLTENLNAFDAWKTQGDWKPANGGTEEPFVARSGRRLLYVFQARSGKHAYLDLDNDLILSDDEALHVLCL